LIDLHTHTTASDGRSTPAELVDRAVRAGVTILSVTDHDTTGGIAATEAACAAARIELLTGIEITAVVEGADVHVLGYFFDPASPALQTFLAKQRERRIDRIREMTARLAAHGIALDVDAILEPGLASRSTSVGRPWIARAMVAAGHVADVNEAFARWLGLGRPAFVPRVGAPPEEVFAEIHHAGGLASLAHPVHLKHDEWLPGYASAGLDALEAYHTDQDAASTARYVALAGRLGLAMTGGSDFHGDDSHGKEPGSTTLPRDAFEQFKARRG
jgi:predicted metal-dependent phosphoesterase TrpH